MNLIPMIYNYKYNQSYKSKNNMFISLLEVKIKHK